MNIIELVADAMSDDDADTGYQSDILIALYQGADADGQRLIDDALTAICGWSMKTLIERATEDDPTMCSRCGAESVGLRPGPDDTQLCQTCFNF